MSTQLLWDGLKAMILGMGMVYIFLVVMIWMMNITGKLLKPYIGLLEAKTPEQKPKARPAAAKTGLSDKDLAAAAIQAVQTYRKENHSNTPADLSIPYQGKTLRAQVVPAGCKAAAPQQTAVPAQKEQPQSTSGELEEIKSPLPGTILRIDVQPGSTIAAGDVLIVIEAMKMETEIKAEHAGTVREVLVNPKDIVPSDAALLLLEVSK